VRIPELKPGQLKPQTTPNDDDPAFRPTHAGGKLAAIMKCFLPLLLSAWICALGLQAADTEIVLDPARPAGVFEGLEAVSAGASSRLFIDYPEPARSRMLDLLFPPKYG
jgi:hypothetical protein